MKIYLKFILLMMAGQIYGQKIDSISPSTEFNVRAAKRLDSIYSIDNRIVENDIGVFAISDSKLSKEFRVHLHPFCYDSGSYVWVRLVNDKWLATKYDYVSNKSLVNKGLANTLSITTASIRQQELTPASGWHAFLLKLDACNINSLPNMQLIADKFTRYVNGQLTQHVGYCGSTYSIQLNDSRLKRMYTFDNPHGFFVNFSDVKEVRDYKTIIDLIEEEFGITFRHPR